MAAPAPKATGSIGYTAYSDVQRNLTFNAIQANTNTCGTFWNVTPTTQLTFFLTGSSTPFTHHVTLTQNGQTVGGSGGYPLEGGVDTFHWNITSGSLIGSALSLTAAYDFGAPGTTMTISGTVNADGSITGSWSDNYGGGTRTGTFTSPAGSATATVSYCGKGTAYYSDAAGNWYLVNVTTVSVSGADAWFAGPVVAGNVGAGQWLFVKVHDGGEPGYLVDKAWGSFTDQATATSGVAGHLTPADGGATGFAITSGNLQVH